jgi:hypothetical protein
MSIHRKAAKRDAVEPAIVDALVSMGASVVKLSARGCPDLLVGFRGEITALVEIKRAKGKLTPDQVAWHECWRGADVVILRSVDEAIEWVNGL